MVSTRVMAVDVVRSDLILEIIMKVQSIGFINKLDLRSERKIKYSPKVL